MNDQGGKTRKSASVAGYCNEKRTKEQFDNGHKKTLNSSEAVRDCIKILVNKGG